MNTMEIDVKIRIEKKNVLAVFFLLAHSVFGLKIVPARDVNTVFISIIFIYFFSSVVLLHRRPLRRRVVELGRA